MSIPRYAPIDAGQFIFVTNLRYGTSEIDVWTAGSSGNVAPSRVIAGSDTGLYRSGGIAVDRKGFIYVANANDRILAFAPDSDGDASPIFTISGPDTGLAHPSGLAFDAVHNLYVSNCGAVCGGSGSPSIEVFPGRSNGDIKPTRVIAGSQTGFTKPHGIAVGKNGEIYLANAGHGSLPATIEVFPPGATGNSAPERVIAGHKSDLYQAGGAMLVNGHGIYTDSWAKPMIERFAVNANGNDRPIARIKGSHTELAPELDGMSFGPNASIYAVDRSGDPQIIQFDGLANGNARPISSIRGSNTRLDIPLWVSFGKQP